MKIDPVWPFVYKIQHDSTSHNWVSLTEEKHNSLESTKKFTFILLKQNSKQPAILLFYT